jgi:hypothetical protein
VTDDFYDEWRRRRPGERRSLRRAALLADALGLTPPGVPVLTVVGSKGKGTAATFASACLAAAGRRVVTVTSPSLRRDGERVRVGGAAISEAELARLGHRLRTAIPPRGGDRPSPSTPGHHPRTATPARTDDQDHPQGHPSPNAPGHHPRTAAPARADDEGYLSPSGLFTLAGLLHARDVGADVVVLEAGMGGVSDEVSLFPPAVLAITRIFAEHLGVLGDTPAAIAADKAGIATEGTTVVSVPQCPDVMAAIAAITEAEVVTEGMSGVPDDLLPPGLGQASAELGWVAAQRLLGSPGGTPVSVSLPGRSSWHPVPGTDATIFVDSAVDRAGVAAALATARRRWGRIDHVLVCLPDHKDRTGALAELAGLPVTQVRMPDRESLRFIPTAEAVDAADLTRERLAAYGRRIVVLGTVYFTGRMLDLVDAPTERLFETA